MIRRRCPIHVQLAVIRYPISRCLDCLQMWQARQTESELEAGDIWDDTPLEGFDEE